MKLTDDHLRQVLDIGFVVVPGFLPKDRLDAARAALPLHFPTPEQLHADPSKYPELAKSQFAGLKYFPYSSLDLNRLPFEPDLVDAIERLTAMSEDRRRAGMSPEEREEEEEESALLPKNSALLPTNSASDIELYKVELWAKYSGSVDYDQPLHRDYGNHSLVVPRSDGYQRQFTTFILLSDVTSEDGPTKAVPLEHTKDIPMHVRMIKNPNPLYEKEVDVVGPAGTLLIYHTAVFHRGSKFTAHPRHRFAMLCDYMVRGPRHQGKMSWPNTGNDPAWTDLLGTLNARQRDLVGFPRTTDRYWNDESLRETEKRFNVKLDDVRAELEKRKARLQARAKQGRL